MYVCVYIYIYILLYIYIYIIGFSLRGLSGLMPGFPFGGTTPGPFSEGPALGSGAPPRYSDRLLKE